MSYLAEMRSCGRGVSTRLAGAGRIIRMAAGAAAAVMLSVIMSVPLTAGNKWVADGASAAVPASTHLFVQRDSALYLDFYKPSQEVSAGEKPAVIFAFGGGFVGGQRDKEHYRQWIKLLNDSGYPVFSIDYRLGLKGADTRGLKMIGAVRHSIEIGVEDMFAATAYIVKNAGVFGISPDNIVIAGSSAGAIIALQAEYELCNHSALASVLPEGFRYRGVISFSGAIFSTRGKVKYAEPPAPQLLLHGTADRVVTYKSIRVFNLGLFGSSKIARRLDRKGYPYTIVRYKDHTHDIADLMYYTFPEQLHFLEESVERNTGRISDILLDDPALPVDNTLRTLGDLYK